MKFSKVLFIFISIFFSFTKAQELPKEKYYQFSYYHDFKYNNDSIMLTVRNPLFAPLRVNIFSDYLKDENIINDTIRVTINENSEGKFRLPAKKLDGAKFNFSFNSAFGDDKKIIKQNELALPFPKGKMYRIMQSDNGGFSHDSDYSRYAIDFDMKIGDTVTSADDGFVVGVIKDYKYGKEDKQWTPYANYITLYHPHSGLFTQYVHLKKDGSLVKVGDSVKRNQPIGLSGATGFVSGEHLHFNVLIPEKDKTLKSVPFTFENNISSLSLKKNMQIKNPK